MTSVLRGLVVGAVLTVALPPTGTAWPAPADTGIAPGRLANGPERSVYRDPETGWEVTRLTRSPAEDIKIYQTHPSWTAGGQWIVFHSNRSGAQQLFAVRETDGRIVQLTDTPGINVGQVCLSRKHLELLTLVDRDLIRLDLQTALSEREGLAATASPPLASPLILGRLPAGSELSGTMGWDAGETQLYLGLHHPGQEPAHAWSIACLNLEHGTWRTVWEPGFRIGHVQTNPWDDDWLMFCHETGGDAPQRMWLARVDGSGEARPLYVETFDEWVTHELWWDVRQVLFTVWPRNEAMTRKPHGLASINLDGVVRFHSRFPYWHVTGASGSPYLVADTFDGRIFRVHRDTGERVVLTQGHRPGQGAHPHPTLDPTGQKVLFNSTAEGQADLYLVNVAGEARCVEHDYRSRRVLPRVPEAVSAWQRALRAELLALLQVDDLMDQPLDLDPEVVEESEHDGFTEREVVIRSTPGRRITVRLTMPPSGHPTTRLPAAVCLHGHGGTRASVYHPTGIYRGFARALAQRGWVTIAADVGQHEVFEPGRTLMGERFWDLKRCVDYLETLPFVDPGRMGCAGLSLGGEMALWLGALDTRIRLTVSSGFLTTMDQMEQNHCMCWKLPGLRELVDFADLYALIAPRPLQCQNGRREGPTDFWVPLARGAMEDVRQAYTDLGRPDNAELVIHEGGHEIDLPSLLRAFESHLR